MTFTSWIYCTAWGIAFLLFQWAISTPVFGVSSSCLWRTRLKPSQFAVPTTCTADTSQTQFTLSTPQKPFPPQHLLLVSCAWNFHTHPFLHLFTSLFRDRIQQLRCWDLWTQFLMFHLSFGLLLHGAAVFREVPLMMLDTFPDWWKVQ